MSYSPTLGRFLERDPIEYEDGLNVYQFARSSPVGMVDPLGLAAAPTSRPARSIADVFDDPNDTELNRIAQQGAGLGLTFHALNKSDQANLEIFVRTQIAILNALANNKCPCLNKQEEQWLLNTVRDFIRPLSESIWERAHGRPITDAGWRQFFKDKDAGAFKRVKVPVGAIRLAPEPLDFVDENLAIARAMALNHINSDLKASLQKNGIGRQALWDCIGKVVDDASREVLGPPLNIGMDLIGWYDDAWDVSAIRDQMRAGIPATQPATQPATAPATRPVAVP